MSKYGNKKVMLDGMTFDSKHEALRWTELRYLQRAGMIEDLQRQVKFELIPKVGKQRPTYYIADFVYQEQGRQVVEDAKGMKTAVYKLKKKLMLWRHGIEIKEV